MAAADLADAPGGPVSAGIPRGPGAGCAISSPSAPTPELAAEVTLQPIRRFGFDAAILFSDILMLPWALGHGLAYKEGEGPVLPPLRDAAGVAALDPARVAAGGRAGHGDGAAGPRGAAGRGVRSTALIGFAGAPFTVACYMVEGGGSRDFAAVRGLAYGDPALFARLIDLLTEATIDYLATQIEAGAEARDAVRHLGGLLPPSLFRAHVIEPAARIVRGAAGAVSRRAGHRLSAARRADDGRVSCRRPGWMRSGWIPRRDMRGRGGSVAGRRCALQGNLDPLALVAGGEAMEERGGGDPGGHARPAVRVQPRAWHRAADAARACGAADGVGACRIALLTRVAIVLFNLGGPDRPEAIRPFLLNLFRDPAILRVPFFVRPLLARWIARARVAPATSNYALLGGRSPLLDADPGSRRRRWKQALSGWRGTRKCFIAMRYWHPFSDGGRARGAGMASGRRFCCCRCIRSIPPRRPAVR